MFSKIKLSTACKFSISIFSRLIIRYIKDVILEKVFRNGKSCLGAELTGKDKKVGGIIKKAMIVIAYHSESGVMRSAAQTAFYVFHIGFEILVNLNLVTYHIACVKNCCMIAFADIGTDLGS